MATIYVQRIYCEDCNGYCRISDPVIDEDCECSINPEHDVRDFVIEETREE